MNLDETQHAGTIQPDGTLILDAPTAMPPGRVAVSVRAIAPPAAEDWWVCLRQGRKDLETFNYPTMTEAEVRSHVEWLRGDEDRIEDVYRDFEEARRRAGPSE